VAALRTKSLGRKRFIETCWKRLARELSEPNRSASLKAGAARDPKKGLVLVRSLWRAEVELMPWTPQFEIAHRRVVPEEAWSTHLWIDDGFAGIFMRAFTEAGLAKE
jgi:hypothetical protein